MAAEKTKTKSRFYVINTAKQTQKKIENTVREKVDTYNRKFFKEPISSGKEFISELKADPIKAIDDLIDDGKAALKKSREERYEALKNNAEKIREKAKSNFEKLNKEARSRIDKPKNQFDKLNTEGKKIVKGVEGDAKLILEDVMAFGRKKLDKVPMKKTLEKKISKGIESIPSKLNLPSRDEIDNLVSGIDGVSKKVDALSKQAAGA